LLDPSPERTDMISLQASRRAFARPVKLLSKAKLRNAWQKSRDNTIKAGRPGIDGVSAQHFAARLDTNLQTLTETLRNGTYGPSRLRAVLIPKPNSEKFRLICIPTIRDRIVQRTIVDYLVENKKFPIYNSSSYGFIKGRGTQSAIARAVVLRSKYDWCLKTDIEAFFDRIPRAYLKDRVNASLRANSLAPLIEKIIDCEIKEDRLLKPRLLKQGIKPGVGVRQGMPLSPILANLVLAEFDREVERADIEMVRYADDILIFFASKAAANEGHDLIKTKLKHLNLEIPELADRTKTELKGPQEPVDFWEERSSTARMQAGTYPKCPASRSQRLNCCSKMNTATTAGEDRIVIFKILLSNSGDQSRHISEFTRMHIISPYLIRSCVELREELSQISSRRFSEIPRSQK
jgi:RNA-directed DNA polymerase